MDVCSECGRPLGRIDDDLLIKLFTGDLTHDDISQIFGVSRVAVTKRVKKLALEKSDMTLEEFKSGKLDHLYRLAMHAYKSMTPSEIEKASLNQKVVLFGTIFDKIDKVENRGEVDSLKLIGVKHIHELGPGFQEAISGAIEQRNARRMEDARKRITAGSVDSANDE